LREVEEISLFMCVVRRIKEERAERERVLLKRREGLKARPSADLVKFFFKCTKQRNGRKLNTQNFVSVFIVCV
jgi:hypothetical protein